MSAIKGITLISDEDGMFYLVANAEAQAGMPVSFLMHPPKAVQTDLNMAEVEAVRLATKTNGRFLCFRPWLMLRLLMVCHAGRRFRDD